MKNSDWQHYSKYKNIPPSLLAWLLYPGSFMERLRNAGIKNLKVIVLNEDWQVPSQDERKILNMNFRHVARLREVQIVSDNNVWMHARTVFPSKIFSGKELRLLHLKNRSLGSILFKERCLKRSDFEIAKIDAKFWGRRSVFDLHGKEILLTEIFINDFAKL